MVRPRRPQTHDEAFEWSNAAAAEALLAAISGQASENDDCDRAVMTVLALAFRAGYYAGLADPLPEDAP